MKTKNWYRIDHVAKTITLSKGFAKATVTMGTDECDQIDKLRLKYHDYKMTVKTISKKDGKKTYKNMKYKYMREYIAALEGEDSVNIENFNKLIASKIQVSPYSFARKWFMKNYPNYTDPEQLVARITNVVSHEVDSYIEEMERKAEENKAA